MKFPYAIVDLTHTLSPTTPSWSGGCGFEHEIKRDYKDCTSAVKFRVQQIKMHAGIGTHIDAPAHCIEEGKTVDQLNIAKLVVPCVVIDVSYDIHERYSLSPEAIQKFEATHGEIKEGAFVMIRTGWERFWYQPDKYRNMHIFPSISREAALVLVSRGIVGIGIDTLSPDRPEDGFPVHQLILGTGRYIIENAAHLDQMPPTGAFIVALPIKAEGATEAPVRLIGLIPR